MPHYKSTLVCTIVLLLTSIFAQAETKLSEPLEVIRITPEGEEVSDGRQIVVTFNRNVVALGRMDRKAEELPIEITPKLGCQWRWLNQTTLACNLDDINSIKKATNYSVVVNPGIFTEDGITLSKAYSHSFTTVRPNVRHAWFDTWLTPGTPVIRVVFNQEVSLSSAEQNLYFEHNQQKIPAVLAVPEEEQEISKTKDNYTYHRALNARPQIELPLDTSVNLKVNDGLVAFDGDLTGYKNDDILVFDTFPEFKFIGVRCRTNTQKEALFYSEQSSIERCDPLSPITLQFSTPLFRKAVRDYIKFEPNFINVEKLDEAWGDLSNEYSQLSRAHSRDRKYEVYLPNGLKANQKYKVIYQIKEPNFFERIINFFRSLFGYDAPLATMHDEFNRPLTTNFSVDFATDNRLPNYELIHKTAVLEKESDSEVPLYVNNINKTNFSYLSLTTEGIKQNLNYKKTMPDVKNIQFAVPFGVRDILNNKSGVVFGNLSTEPAAVMNKWPESGRLFAQVTPWQVHAKLGHFSSLIWVTDLKTGQPVENAKVTLYRSILSMLSIPDPSNILASGVTDANGLLRLAGSETIDPHLNLLRYSSANDPAIFIHVSKDSDMALLPANWEFEIDIWRASNENISTSNRLKAGHIKTWGATAQGIYRAGDTIDYKIYVRDQNDQTFKPAPQNDYKLEILNPMDNVVHTVDNIKLNNFGATHGKFAVPDSAPVGWYRFKLTANFTTKDPNIDEYFLEENYTWYPLQVLVSDFTPAPFKVSIDLNGDIFTAGQTITATTAAKLHSGGPYTDANVRVTAAFTPQSFRSKNKALNDYTFNNVNELTTRQLLQVNGDLNSQGELATNIDTKLDEIIYGQLSVESAVRDERGKYIAKTATAQLTGRDLFVGLKNTAWIYNAKKEASVEYIVVDLKGEPVGEHPLTVHFEKQVTKSAKVKSAGNAYTTQYSTTWEPVAKCQSTSDNMAKVCSFVPDSAGYYRARAVINDRNDLPVDSIIYLWVSGSDFVNWHNESDVLLEIISEQSEYKVGDNAKFLVKNPWPGSEALITVERYGIIDSFTRKLEDNMPIIEIPIKPDYLPGVYMSVLVTSPRVVDAPIAGEIDLGKPAYRLGYITIPVKDPYKELQIDVSTNQETYRPRDQVDVTITAKPRNIDKDEPIELAVAVLDESVFDLIAAGTKAYDPYRGFYKLGGLDLQNFNLLTRLIGRQKFEKKGANPGGDGGSDFSMRDLFKYVAYWNPTLPTDSKGQANFKFEVPDNLTGWRILAMGVTPSDRLGLGQANFKVNRPTEIRPVMPNQVTEGDIFKSAFSVMNRTDQARTLTVNITASGAVKSNAPSLKHSQEVNVEPYKRVVVKLDIATTNLTEDSNITKGHIDFIAEAFDQTDKDRLKQTVTVHKKRTLETGAIYGSTEEDATSIPIDIPNDIYPDQGGVNVVLTPTVIGAVKGAFKYMRDYPYYCWEQRLTKGILATQYNNLKNYIDSSFTWPESKDIPHQLLNDAAAFQAPNGGMTYYIAQDQYTCPYLSAFTALAFNWLKSVGHEIPQAVENKLHHYLLHFLRNDATPTYFTDGMKATTRAVVLAAMAEHKKITVEDLVRFRPQLKNMSLFGKAHYLQAAIKLADDHQLIEESLQNILSYSNQTSGKLVFSEELDDGYLRILASPVRDNCAILSALTEYSKRTESKTSISDMPFKMVRYITQSRKAKEYWQNTQENMFCMQALVDYSKAYESKPINYTVQTKLGSNLDSAVSFGTARFQSLQDNAVNLAKPMSSEFIGQKTNLFIERIGTGRLYYNALLRYAPRTLPSTSTNAGIQIKREYSVERDGKWILLKSDMPIKQGELIRSDIYLSLPAARNFVVVNDPLPGGLETVNSDLATASTIDANKAGFIAAENAWYYKYNDWIPYAESRWSFYHSELRHDRAVFYSEYLPAGNYHLSFTAQAIAAGSFAHLPVHAEEMYDPDIYGKGIYSTLNIEPN